ncbi:uncharacterized protein (DUF58 family) [Mycobacterium sp. BK086]|uniref:DUF58 domain-containing protein n=1 Tax=Mycobacterium sp. BK086 TaxID=2512165 RepID=UPI00105D7345|nr:DUF58 domain-containing protein [Mycobacterium sp. BK086]TDO12253.1 uncharacterized protein (DUF58 family) [Mycobacterium sp. BK086]
MDEGGEVEVVPAWRASPSALALATCAAAILVAAVCGSRWQLIVFATPLIGALYSIYWPGDRAKVRVRSSATRQYFFESEQARLTVSVTGKSITTVRFSASDNMEVEVVEDEDDRHTVLVSASRWGRYAVQAHVTLSAAGGLLRGTAVVDVSECCVFPIAPPQDTALPRAELPDRLGSHLTRHVGPGVEFADIRAYVPGDQLRSVNWPVSARRRALHVTERLTDRAADVVVLVDTHAQPLGPATEATDRMARGAVQVVQTSLRQGDRAGIVALGDRRTHWLGAEMGKAQFYRILDTILEATGRGPDTGTSTLAPPGVIPPGAIVIGFSTLLDTDFALAVIDLRKRGHTVVVVDLLVGPPFTGECDPMVPRLWALQRSFMHRDMGTIGVDVVPWSPEHTVDQAMQLVPQHRRPKVHRR